MVSASTTQLLLLRCYVRSLYTPLSREKMRYGLMSRKTDLEESDIRVLETFYRSSFSFASVLSYSSVLSEMSDLGYLWMREFFLERAGAIQFPIDMSIPWILTEHISTVKGTAQDVVPHTEKIFFILDIYNDAANNVLYNLGKQHLYNEIEAEANLILDQLVFLLSEEIYMHYKNGSAVSSMEKSFRSKLEELKGSPYLTWCQRRYDLPLIQRNAQILGRSVDVNFLLGRHLNDKLRHDIECAIKRFESASVCGLPELQLSLDILSSTHKQLSKYLDLDSFTDMLAEIDENFAPSSVVSRRGRISSHVVYSLVCDIFPNYSYNFYTQRFVPSPVSLQQCAYGNPPKRTAVEHMMGSVSAKAHERVGILTRGYFGRIHLETLLNIIGYAELPRLVDECLQILTDKLQDLTAYVVALGDHVNACHLPSSCNKNAEHAYAYFQTKLTSLLEFDDLKPEVFQNFRYIGNAIAFFRDISIVLEVHDQFEFLAVAPLLGVVPDNRVGKESGVGARSPYVKALRNFAKSDNDKNAYSRHKDEMNDRKEITHVDAYLLQELPGLAHRAMDVLAPAIGSHNLFDSFLSRFYQTFTDLQLHSAWNLRVPSYFVPESAGKEFIPAAHGFQRLWATLTFLFYEQETETGKKSQNRELPYCAHEDEFGHGFFFAGSYFAHIMEHHSGFGMMDYGETIVRVHLEAISRHLMNKKQAVVGDRVEHGVVMDVDDEGDDDLEISLPVALFIDNAMVGKQLMMEMQTYFRALSEKTKYTLHHSGSKHAANDESIHGGDRHKIELFHPPKEIQ